MATCPICHSTGQKSSLCKVSFTYGSEFDLLECDRCKGIYYSPIPSTEKFIEFYLGGGYQFDRWKQEQKAIKLIKQLQKHVQHGRFLDVGCATGYLLDGIARHSSWDVYGVELSEKPVRFAREMLKLENVVQGDLLEVKYPDEYFSCVHIGDVLEHVPDPVALLKECRRILKMDGVLWLRVPNGYNDSRSLVRAYQEHGILGRHAAGHIYFFQKKTFAYMFEAAGFSVLESETKNFKAGIRNMGWLPMPRNWAKGMQASPPIAHEDDPPIPLITKKRYPDIYYRYRHWKGDWMKIKGVHDFGQDLRFLLVPKNDE